MATAPTITVGPREADFTGTTNEALQAAVDHVAARGGGTVQVAAGVYEMADSLHLRSGVTVRGAGRETVLRKAASVVSPIVGYLGYGHYDVSLAEPDRFRVGMGVWISDERSMGFYDTVATLTWREGERFGLSRFLNHDYGEAQDGRVVSVYPVISGYHVEDAAVADLVIDGNREANERLHGCRGGGVFLLGSRKVRLNRLCVECYHGDGISFQQCVDLRIEDGLLTGNAGAGLHPGSGSVGAVVRNVKIADNGADGIYYCLRAAYSLCEGCEVVRNGGPGISIGGRDTDHWIRGNTIHDNRGPGILFRAGSRYMGAHRNRIEGNTIVANGGAAQVLVEDIAETVHLLHNRIAGPGTALRIGAQCRDLVVFDNEIEGAVEIPEGTATFAAPAKQLRVGPEHRPPAADRHLRPEG